MASVLTYEAASADDLDALVALRIDAMRESLERIGRFDPARARERFARGFDPTRTWHVLRDGKRVGFFVVKPHPEGLLLDHLYVQPTHQGQASADRSSPPCSRMPMFGSYRCISAHSATAPPTPFIAATASTP